MLFCDADADKDGLLNKEEYLNFTASFYAKMREKHGDWVPEYSAEDHDTYYAQINKISDEDEGISMDDYMAWRTLFYELVAEIVGGEDKVKKH